MKVEKQSHFHMKIYLNYDYQFSPKTTAFYIEHALYILGHEVVKKEEQGIDIVLNVEPCEVKTVKGAKTIYWEIDSYIHKGNHLPWYNLSDVVFIAQKPDLSYYPEHTYYLPLAADPFFHQNIPTEVKFDIVFTGRVDDNYQNRRELIGKLSKQFGFQQDSAEPGVAYSRTLSQGRLILNRSKEYDINMRFFEGMAVGTLLTNHVEGLEELATPFTHYIPYTSEEDCIERAKEYLADEKKRIEIAKEARNLILSKHTYVHRVKEMFSKL